MTSLVLTFIGDDRPGLVSAISEKVVDFGGTWLESRSVRLAGKFAGVVLVRVPDENLIPLESALAKLAPSGLRVSIERGAAAEAEKPARLVTLEIVGKERPGIVRDVTQALTHLGVNIEEFMSGLEGEPFARPRASASPTGSSLTNCARLSSGWRPRSWSTLRSVKRTYQTARSLANR
jgi:glycine cleavage system regulatory protein